MIFEYYVGTVHYTAEWFETSYRGKTYSICTTYDTDVWSTDCAPFRPELCKLVPDVLLVLKGIAPLFLDKDGNICYNPI